MSTPSSSPEQELCALREWFEQSPIAMARLCGAKHLVERANPAFLRLFDHRSLCQRTLEEVLPELRANGFIERLDRVYRTGERDFAPCRVAGGSPSHAGHFLLQPLKDAAGQVTGVLVQALPRELLGLVDGTQANHRQPDAAQATDTVQENEEMIRLALRGGRMGAWVRDLTDNSVRWSPDLERLFGLAPGSFGGSMQAFRNLVHPEDRSTLEEAVERAIATQSDYSAEFRFRHASGEWHWMEGRGRAVYDEAGRAIRLHGVGMDITERKRIEEELAYQRDLLRSVTDNAQTGILLMDSSGRGLWVNPAAEAMTGYTRDELVGEVLHELIHNRYPDGRPFPIEECPLDRALRLGQNLSGYEDVFIRKDGSLFPVRCSARPVYRDGKPYATVIEVWDITQEKVTDQALRLANRRKDEFLATLAHELRNPLAPIRNAAYLLKRSTSPDPQLRTARDIIDRQVHHMVRLVDDLLDVSRITLGQISLRHETVSLGRVLTDAIEAARPLIEAAEHTLVVHLPSESMQLEGDPTRLSQVFQNLLNNAAKYTQKNGSIMLRVERDGRNAIVSVRDNGVGIPKEFQSRVFELFTRVHPGEEIKTSGLGIGLALARQLVELHGGDIEVRSEGTGHGSEFVVRLPLLESAASLLEPALTEDASHPRSCERRVLVVDDNRDAAESLAMLLKLSGCAVDVAFDGLTALESVERFRPEIVLLDIGMPGMDGYETARRIRSQSNGNTLLLVALTGWGQEEDKRRARDAGFDEHLTKPVDPALLSTLIQVEGAAAGRGA